MYRVQGELGLERRVIVTVSNNRFLRNHSRLIYYGSDRVRRIESDSIAFFSSPIVPPFSLSLSLSVSPSLIRVETKEDTSSVDPRECRLF